MKYLTKVVINGTELTSETSESAYITGVTLSDVVASSAMEIGATGSSGLAFTIMNSAADNYDGEEVEFMVSPVEDEQTSVRDTIIEEVDEEEDVQVAGADEEDSKSEGEEDLGEDGDDLTEEEEAEATAEIEEENQSVYEAMEGTDETVETETTDEAEEAEWTKIGTFTVYSQAAINGQIRLVCYDSFAVMNDTFTPSNKTDTIAAHYADFSARLTELGVSADTDVEMPSETITWDKSVSYRDAAGYFAGLCGGYADFDEDGMLCINQYANANLELLKTELISQTSTSGGDTVITGLSCNGLISGEIASISFENPFMTQSILDDIYSSYQGIRLSGQTLTCMWEPSLQAGTFLRLMSEDEFRSYLKLKNYILANGADATSIADLNSFGDIVPVTSVLVSFSGDAVAQVESRLSTVTETDNPTVAPVEKKAQTAYDNASDALTTAEAAAETAQEVATMIRNLDEGVLVCKTYQNTGALVNADGSFDVVSLTWENGEPVIGDPVASFGDAVTIGRSDSTHAVLGPSGFEIQNAAGTTVYDLSYDGYTEEEVEYTSQARIAFNFLYGSTETWPFYALSANTVDVAASYETFIGKIGEIALTKGTDYTLADDGMVYLLQTDAVLEAINSTTHTVQSNFVFVPVSCNYTAYTGGDTATETLTGALSVGGNVDAAGALSVGDIATTLSGLGISGSISDHSGVYYIGDLLIQWGRYNFSSLTANTVNTADITFSQPFGAIPNIQVSGWSAAAAYRTVGFTNPSKTGFTATLYRTNTTGMSVDWLAVGVKA